MNPTVQELQDWIDLYYPDNRDFSGMLSYWKNEMVKFELEQKRLSHQAYKDIHWSINNE